MASRILKDTLAATGFFKKYAECPTKLTMLAGTGSGAVLAMTCDRRIR